MIKLDDLVLPNDLQWVDEFQWLPNHQNVAVALDGALILEQSFQQAGRKITLVAGDDYAWLDRPTVEALYALAKEERTMTLTLSNGQQLPVVFRYDDGALEASPLYVGADYYTAKINLMEITP